MEEDNGIRGRNLYNYERNSVVNIMRFVELNGGIIPQNPTAAAATETRGIEDENLVSTVRVNTVPMGNIYHHQLRGIESLSENIDIRGLDDRWRGDNVHRLRLNEESEDYLTTLTFPRNFIVVRRIQDFRQPNEQLNFSTETQIIWNSRFSWREIKQYLEDYTYNFDFRLEIIIVTSGEQSLSRSLSEEEIVNNISAAVDGLPTIIISSSSEESENGDGVICPICQDSFSTTHPAKQLSCKHLYHSKWILEWFRLQNSCPICRRQPPLHNINPLA